MADLNNADPFNKLTFDAQSPPIPKDMQGSDSSVPFSPQWLLPKLGDNKIGLEAGEKHPDSLKALGNIQVLNVSEKKNDVFRPSFYNAEKVRRDCWTDEEREANSASRRDIQKEAEELGDSRKLERWSNSSSRYSSESRHFPPERWTGSGNREGSYEPRRESKWNTRWGPDDKESETWREKGSGRDGESYHNKGGLNQTINVKDIKMQGKITDKDGEHHSRSWRSASAVNRGRGENSPYPPSTTNKQASMFSYGRGKGDTGASIFSVDRSKVGTGNLSGGGPTRHFHSDMASEKTNSGQRGPPGLRYSRMKLFDIYRMTDLKGYTKAFEGFQEFPSLIRTEHLVPLALTAPLTEELVIMEAIENGEILSSGVSQASKDVSTGNHSVDSGLLPLTKSGIGDDVSAVASGYRDERTNHAKKDHIFYVESAAYDSCSQVFDSKMSSSESLGQYQETAITSDACKLEAAPNITHDLNNLEASKVENAIPWISQSVGRRSLLSSKGLRDLAKDESGSSDKGWLNRREVMGNPQWQDPINLRSDTMIDSGIRRKPPITIEQSQGDFFIHREKLSDQMPQQYPSPEHLSLFYKDPQGQIQGPFSGSNLIEWFDAGYFGLDLLVRVANAPVDTPFSMLGDVVPQLRTRVRPPPGFGASKPNDVVEVSNRGKIGGAVGIHLGIPDSELTKNVQVLGPESKVEAENRFLESLMAGRLEKASYLSEGVQGYNGIAGSRTSLEIGSTPDVKYMPQKISLEQQHLLNPYRTGNDPTVILSKADNLREVPTPQKFLPQIGESPYQHLDLLSILQSATNKTPTSPINSALPLWPNFPEVEAMKNTNGGIDIIKNSSGLHSNQQSSQTGHGTLPNRLQTQFQPSLSNQTPFFGFSSGILPPEKSVAPEFSQDAQMVNLLQQYMFAQNVHSQVPQSTHLNQMELLLLLQRQKMEQQNQLISHALSGNHLHNRYDEQSFQPLKAEAVNVSTARESPVQLMNEGARRNLTNVLNLNDSHVLSLSSLNLHGDQNASITGGIEQLHLPNQVIDLASHSKEMDVPVLDVELTQPSMAEQLISTTNKLAVSQEFPQTNETVTITSNTLNDLVSSKKNEVDKVKNSLSAISKQTHGETPDPKKIANAEVYDVKKASEKKSKKNKNSQLLKTAPGQKLKPNFEAGVEKDLPMEAAEPIIVSSKVALDKKTIIVEAIDKEDEFIQLSSNSMTWNPAPGQKVKSFLEIQMEERTKAQMQSFAASMPNNMLVNVSITSEQEYAVDSTQCDRLAQAVSENIEKNENPWNLRNRSQLHDDLAEDFLPSEVSEREKVAYSFPLLSQNEAAEDHDFIEAKDARKARKKAAKIKSGTTKSSLPSSSTCLPVPVSTAEKTKAVLQPQQDKELLISPPSAPSLGDFVFWKGEQASRAPPPVWSTDSVKVQKPALLKDIFKEQDKNTKSGRQQIPVQSHNKVHPSKQSGGSSLGQISAALTSKIQLVSPIQTSSVASGHQKSGMEDDLFWGPLNQTKLGIRSEHPTIANPNSEKMKAGNLVKVARGEGSSKKAPNTKLVEHSTTTSSPSSSIKQSLPKGKKDSEPRNSDAADFRNWCEGEWFRLTGTNDTSFLEFCLKQSTTEAEALLRENVSFLDRGKEFVDKFVDYKKFLSSEAIEIAFQGPRSSGISSNVDAEADGVDGSSRGKKKGKKGKKVSPALLGFNVASNRIMMGEIQTIED